MASIRTRVASASARLAGGAIALEHARRTAGARFWSTADPNTGRGGSVAADSAGVVAIGWPAAGPGASVTPAGVAAWPPGRGGVAGSVHRSTAPHIFPR